MKLEPTSGMVRVLEAAVIAAALGSILVFVSLAVFRLGYGFELEWMEGGTLGHVERILDGEKLYVEPSIGFVPFIYTPFYYYLSAVAARIAGDGFAPLRLVSFVASVGCLALIFLTVERETRSRFAGLAAAGLFAAAFGVTGAWLDLARVDALFLLLTLFSAYLLLADSSVAAHLFAGVLAVLAVFTKQTGLITLAPLGALALTHGWRSGLVFVGTVVVLVGGGVLALDEVHDGWFFYYVFQLPAAHSLNLGEGLGWSAGLLVRAMPLALLGTVGLLVVQLRGTGARKGLAYLLFAAGLLGGSAVAGLHHGSYDNVALPGVAALAILGAVALDRGLSRARSLVGGRRVLVEAGITMVCLAQFALLAYDPRPLVPTERDKTAGETLVEEIRRVEGDVLVPRHGYLARRAGKGSYAHEMAMTDVLRGDPTGRGIALKREIGRYLQAQKFGAIIVDYDWLKDDLGRYYERRKEPVFLRRDVFWPVTGSRTRPLHFYLPRKGMSDSRDAGATP